MLPLLLLIAGADPTPPFIVTNKTPAFVVTNQIVPATTKDDTPTDLSKPTPPGWEKVKIGDGPWHFRKIAAPAVAAPRPFPAVVMPDTIAQPAVTFLPLEPARGSFAGSPQAATSMSAPRVMPAGGTNCPATG